MREFDILFREIEREFERMNHNLFGNTDMRLNIIPAKQVEAAVKKQKDCQCIVPRRAVSDVYETEKSLVGSFELPGVDKKDIELNADPRHIEVKVKQQKNPGEKDAYLCFYRHIALPKEIAVDKITAEYRNGLLRVDMPKKQQFKRKLIEVK